MLGVRVRAAMGRGIGGRRAVRTGCVGGGFLPLILVGLLDHMAFGKVILQTTRVTRGFLARPTPVSCTHLTLPTIYSV